MKDYPILFRGEMVRAILEGRKTQTRRICKLEGLDQSDLYETRDGDLVDPVIFCPYGRAGDRLWVREAFDCPLCEDGVCEGDEVVYKATPKYNFTGPWKPSIHLPRWASRITLKITKVRVERVQEISEEDAKSEGVGLANCGVEDSIGGPRTIKDHRTAFVGLWQNMREGTPYSWEKNPWVWVIEFKRIA